MTMTNLRRIAVALGAAAGVVAFMVLVLAVVVPGAFVLARNLFGFAGLRPGEPAPDISLAGVDGRPFRLSDQRGKIVVVRFWSPDCAACRSELESIRATAGRYATGGDVVFVTVVSRMPPAQVAQFVRDNGIRYPVALDESGAVADAYLVDALPYTYLLTTDGRVLRSFVGSGNAFQIFREAQTCRAGGAISACVVRSESVP
jgi:peroxiredoxin